MFKGWCGQNYVVKKQKLKCLEIRENLFKGISSAWEVPPDLNSDMNKKRQRQLS